MSSHRVEIQVGIAVLLSIVLLVVGLLWFEQYTYRSEHIQARVGFPQVGGLAHGDMVHVRGIPMGKVKTVTLREGSSGVDVTLEVDAGVKFTDTTIIEIQAVGLAGERILAIDPGNGQPVDPATHVFAGTYSPAVTEMAGKFEGLSTRLSSVLDRVDRLLAQVEASGGVGDAVSHSTRAARGLADLVERNGDAFAQTTRSMARVSAQLDSLIAGPGKRIAAGAEQIAGMSARLDTLVTDLTQAADAAAAVLTAIRNQEGSVGRLVYDKTLITEAEATIQEVRALLADIKRNPDRYLGLKLVDF
jgi:phospholipid/cholesterol/gamma-HCH transport system substrate-binding protein